MNDSEYIQVRQAQDCIQFAIDRTPLRASDIHGFLADAMLHLERVLGDQDRVASSHVPDH